MRTKLAIVITILALAGWGCTPKPTSPSEPKDTIVAEGPTFLRVNEQTVINGVLVIEEMQLAQDVWVVVQADDNGQPGRILSRSTYSGRAISNVRMTLEAGASAPLLHISVHADNGGKGIFEPTTADKLLSYNNLPIRTTVHVTYEGSSTAAPVTDYSTPPASTSTNGVEINIDAVI